MEKAETSSEVHPDPVETLSSQISSEWTRQRADVYVWGTRAMKKTTSNISPEPHGTAAKREILVPASVRIAREKIAAKLAAGRQRAAARAKMKQAREEREIAKAAMRIAKALDRKAALREREAARLDRKAQRLAFQLARKDRIEEQRRIQRVQREELRKKRKKAKPRK